MRRSYWKSRILTGIFLVLSSIGWGGNVLDLEANVRSRLETLGLHEGYDVQRKRFIGIGSATFTVKNPKKHQAILSARDSVYASAYLAARSELMRAVRAVVSGESKLKVSGNEETGAAELKEEFRQGANVALPGCVTLFAMESLDDSEESNGAKVYSLALAVAWSGKLQRAVLKVRHEEFGAPQDITEWKKFVQRNDLASMVGCRQFTGEDGRLRWIGVGVYNGQNLAGPLLDSARSEATRAAERNLLFELFCDGTATTVTEEMLLERDGGVGPTKLQHQRKMSDVVTNVCRGKSLHTRMVYAGILDCPMTGKKVFVCAIGIGPVDSE